MELRPDKSPFLETDVCAEIGCSWANAEVGKALDDTRNVERDAEDIIGHYYEAVRTLLRGHSIRSRFKEVRRSVHAS